MNKAIKTRTVHVGNVLLGSDHPIVVQTMCNTHTSDVDATVAQCERLIKAGAQLIRITVPSLSDVAPLKEIRRTAQARRSSADCFVSPTGSANAFLLFLICILFT